MQIHIYEIYIILLRYQTWDSGQRNNEKKKRNTKNIFDKRRRRILCDGVDQHNEKLKEK